MKISFVLPHVELYGGVRRILEIANILHSSHEIVIYTPKGLSCDWMTVFPPINNFDSLYSDNHDYFVYTLAYFHPVFDALYNNGKIKHGVYYILHDETLYDNAGIDPRPSYKDDRTIKLANSTWTSKRVSNYCQPPLVCLGGVDPLQFYPIRTQKKTIDLLGRGADSTSMFDWKGQYYFEEACKLLDMEGTTLRALSPSQDKLAEVYNSAKYFISTSLFEGWSQCQLEAMACGVPVITSADGGSSDYATHKFNSIIVPAGSSYAIKWAVKDLIDNPSLTKELINNGIDTARQFTWSNCADTFLNLITKKNLKQYKIKKFETPKKVVDRSVYKNGFLVDIVIPVFNAIKDLKECLDSIIKYTGDIKYRIILINDKSDSVTTKYINLMSKEYSHIEVITNSENIGYLQSINSGLIKYKTPYKVCLNSDVIVTPNWLDKLLKAAESDPSIGLVSPLTNNATQLTVKVPYGSNFMEVDNIITQISKKLYPDVATIVGFCLLIKQEVIDAIGVFDEEYNPGYYEECDYQYRAMELDYRAVICDDCYIYHKGSASFKEEKVNLLAQNRGKFHSKWDKMYLNDYAKFDKDNKIGYLRDKITQNMMIKPPQNNYDVVFVLPSIDVYGGVFTVFEIANNLLLMGLKVGIAVVGPQKVQLDSYISPLVYNNVQTFLNSNLKSKIFVATHYFTVDPVVTIANKTNSKTAYFIQDFEGYFDDADMQTVINSYSKIKNRIVISQWLQDRLTSMKLQSTKINMGVDIDIFYPRDIAKKPKFTVVGMARGQARRGFKDLKTVFLTLKKLDPTIDCLFFGSFKDTDFPHLGVLDRYGVAEVLSSAHVALDTSIYQGYGLIGLEAMACGCGFLTTKSMGVDEYCSEDYNTMYSNVGDPFAMAVNVLDLKHSTSKYNKFIQNGLVTAKKFTTKAVASNFYTYFHEMLSKK